MNKMLITDIDGTLTNSKGNISYENKKVISKLIQKGVIVALCTGRNITKTLPVAKALNIKTPLICIDGILLYDTIKNNIIYDISIDETKVKTIIDIAEKYNVFTEVSNGYFYYKHIHFKYQKKYDIFNKHTPLGYLKSYFDGVRYVKDYNRLKNIKGNFYQVSFACGKDCFYNLSNTINNLGFEDIEVRNNLWENYIFVNRKGADKYRGIELLCQKYGISPEETVSIGDDLNDLDMLRYCQTGVAMKNAPKKVKAIANFVTDSNDNGGFVKACEKFFVL